MAFAKIETWKIKRRMRRSHRSRAELGKPVGGTRSFDWFDDRLTLDPVEAPLFAKAVEQFIVSSITRSPWMVQRVGSGATGAGGWPSLEVLGIRVGRT